MPQLSLYLDDATMADLRADAEKANASLSQYARDRLRESHTSAWPEDYWSLFGALDDDTFLELDDIDVALDRPIPAFD